MGAPRRSLTAQIDELTTTLDERRRAAGRNAQALYRVESLAAALDTLHWIDRNAERLREIIQLRHVIPSMPPQETPLSEADSADRERPDGD
jgi:hypothetical protein